MNSHTDSETEGRKERQEEHRRKGGRSREAADVLVCLPACVHERRRLISRVTAARAGRLLDS